MQIKGRYYADKTRTIKAIFLTKHIKRVVRKIFELDMRLRTCDLIINQAKSWPPLHKMAE
jgi:hypothetical protein